MKTKIFTFLVVLIGGLFMTTSAFAQPSHPQGSPSTKTALDGSTEIYTVTSLTNATYHWKLDGGSKSAVSSVTSNSITIVWDDATAGTTYNLDVYAVDENGCFTEMKRTSITIKKATIDLDASQVATTCAWLAGENATGNTSAADQMVINVTSDGGITPAAITYDIYDGATLVDNRPASVTLKTGSFTVDIDSKFVNTSGLNKDFKVKLNSATDKDGNPMNVGTTEATITIHSTSVISFQ
ncbi:MAG: hypothetical protein PHP53_06290 [Prolixibacteraceae bacterium]|nr:hypothetical protein [Prolixibacteraceae bacterium]